ncbi:MAG: hypothetical protein M3Y66_02810 [Actinomycetota bacterium]|nr:hypothetical protein [Actinomycetota bacterium]
MTTPDRSKQMYLIEEDLARAHPGRRRWRGNHSAPGGRLSRETDRALSARLALARLMYGGHAR